jgi:hypothetical protein
MYRSFSGEIRKGIPWLSSLVAILERSHISEGFSKDDRKMRKLKPNDDGLLKKWNSQTIDEVSLASGN